MAILDMPNELLLSVGETLSTPDLYSFLSTCSRLSSLFTSRLHDLVVQDEGGTAVLKWAMEHSHTPLAKLAISLGAEIDKLYKVDYGSEQGNHHHTPLHWAAFHGHSDAIRFLLARGAKMDAKDYNDETPLHLAALHGRSDATRVLLELGADMACANERSEMPAHLAARGSVDCMEAFVDAGFDLSAKGPCGGTVLHVAAHYTSINMVEYLLGQEEVKVAIDAQDWDLFTPLHLAVLDSEIVKLLLRHGADMEVRNSKGLMPAHRAACGDIRGLDPESLRVFIDAGFDLTLRASHNQTVLHYVVAFFHHQEVVEYLLEQPATRALVNAQDQGGRTPLSWIDKRSFGPEREWMTNSLIRYGADLGLADWWEKTPADRIRMTHLGPTSWWDIDISYSHWDDRYYIPWDEDYQSDLWERSEYENEESTSKGGEEGEGEKSTSKGREEGEGEESPSEREEDEGEESPSEDEESPSC